MELTTTELAVTSAFLCVALSIASWHWRRRRLYELASKFEGPPLLPIIGNAILFAVGNEAILNRISELTKLYPSPFRVWLGHRLILGVSDPDQVKAILLSPKSVAKGYMYDFFVPVVGPGLVTAPPPIWKVHRKLIQPTFNAKIINSFADVFVAQSKILADKFEQKLDGPEFEVFDLVALTTMNMLCETVIGLNIGEHANSVATYLDAVQKTARRTSARIFNLFLYPDFIFNRTQLGRDYRRVVGIIHDFADNVIELRKRGFLKSSSPADPANSEDDEHEGSPRRRVFLDSLLKLSLEGDQWSDEELRYEVTTMIITGFDSTAITNTVITLMLASHPEVQEKVYQELCEIYGDGDIDERPITLEDLARMDYLERVIKETMRLFPLLPILARRVTDDLNIGEHTLPQGSDALIPVLEIHRSEKYWPDPLKFDPDRFLPEEVAKRHPYTYLAFSAGPRNCIGIKYAMMAMKTLQATILRRYILKKDSIVPVKDIQIMMETTIKTVDPIKLRIERRTRN